MEKILPKFKSEEYLEEFKEQKKDLLEILSILEFYSEKHFDRQERELKKSFYIDYVVQ